MSRLFRSLLILFAVLLSASSAVAQATPPVPEGGLYVTIFRNPSTGLEWRGERYGIHAGFYPTIIKADGQGDGENTNFIRIGGSAYLRSSGWTPYFAPSLLLSLDDDWDNGILWDLGHRIPFGSRAAFRLGVGVLTTFDGEVRVNPTVGFDVKLGPSR